MPAIRLGEIAYARSGDKGAGANIGVIARTSEAYEVLREHLTTERVEAFFAPMKPGRVVRYEAPNLLALNFVLPEILDGGGSVSLRIDAQGKALGQAILELTLEWPDASDAAPTSNLIQRGAWSPELAVLTLNRPEKRNALNLELMQALRKALEAEQHNLARRVVILAANGPAFCAGLDLKEAAEAGGAARGAETLALLYEAMVVCPLVTIAMAHGDAVGGGVGLLATCDVVVAAEDLTLRLPEVQRGITPALVTSLLIRQIGERAVREMTLLGQTVAATRAFELGLLNKVVRREDLTKTARELAQQCCLGAPGAVKHTKMLINSLGARPVKEDLQNALTFHRADKRSGEAAEGAAAFLEKRRPKWVPPDVV